ncbi:rhamnogalacturonan lyase [Cellulomonas shaoxiangyii]|uniref:Rhamnogalacturonan lyase n=1 Tax=Cellulomonas shaoxiangyii TaxID=2566013 RepID=A0A4P7SQ21_9CELL|nr:rhamnogalacturonan lyase [Cellulomonas shaoxiangyii]TGY85664.1 rhamnogalacturonan lyase [Cellulomonas shaoxiangyii]
MPAAVCVGALALAGAVAPAAAAPAPATGALAAKGGHRTDAVQLERLDRGVVAVATSEGVFVSWRLLAPEVTGATADTQTGPQFAVYRDGARIATVEGATNLLDADGAATSVYRVAAVVDGVEVDVSPDATPWAGHHDIPLRRPADGVTPAGEAYTYAANDMSVGDVDGDGQYEYLVKWDPSNSKDVSQVGYTGNVYLDAYELDGRHLWRVDLGVNVRAGAHYTQFPVADFDGDGRAELMVKTAPGTTITTYAPDGSVRATRPVTLPADDVAAGVTHADDYRMSRADYYEHVVEMFRGWSTREEVVSGQWPATLEEAFGIAPQYTYPLSDADARALTDYFMDVYAPGRSARNVLRNFEGFVLEGPEYLTVVGGDGRELQTVDYKPGRTDDGLLWGDYAMSRIEPGNRVDRFLSGVAYLDGQQPSAVFARGYYTRSTLVAYDWDGKRLQERWYVDSGWTPMTNPFNDGPHGRPGTDPEFGRITTQGFHSLSAADVDADGRHEIVYGSATIDDDGSLLYTSFATMPEGSATPGVEAGLGHGDAMHVTDIDPQRPGLEIFTVHEGGAYAPYGMAMRDAATGETLFGVYSGRDTGRGMIGDVRPDVPGLEAWASLPGGSDASGLYSADGDVLQPEIYGTNQSIRWAADGTTQLVNGSGTATPTIDDATRGTLLTATGTLTNNGTKGNPSLVADVLGDWREELFLRTADSSAIRVFASTEVTDRGLVTLMHDPQYRAEVARQQTTYNQPSYPGFYLASDTDMTTVPVAQAWLPGSIDALRATFQQLVASGQVRGLAVLEGIAAIEIADRAADRGQTRAAVAALDAWAERLERMRDSRLSSATPAARTTLTTQIDRITTALR